MSKIYEEHTVVLKQATLSAAQIFGASMGYTFVRQRVQGY